MTFSLVPRTGLLAAALLLSLSAPAADAGGTLTPTGAVDQEIKILDHHVDVTLNNGFARVEVFQTFFNPNAYDLEARYSFPVPESGSLSEMSIFIGETQLDGEVIEKTRADKIYEEERAAGNDAGHATKESYLRYEFAVSPVRAGDETSFRFVYYQPLKIDTGVGRFLYPLENGGTDEIADAFWTTNTVVERSFSMNVDVRSAVPLASVRMPGYEAAAVVTQKDLGDWNIRLDAARGSLADDIVVYYKLAEDLPGRIEVIPYKPTSDATGTYMLVMTPGIDLAPLSGGADYVFVLDRSGSMKAKLHTLAKGVRQAIGQMHAGDRVRVVTFAEGATEITKGWTPCTPENIAGIVSKVERLEVGGGTNVHRGLAHALRGLDDDRATSIVLVTDGVANEGIVEPRAFHDLLSQYDVRVFGFLMGNGSNWPLMRTICSASGGFYAGVSNTDDIVGQILLAKSKIAFECLHDARIAIRGVDTHGTTGENLGKVFRGQQLVSFGRYDKAGRATVSLDATLTGADKTYSATFDFPEVATENPEIERLWAMAQIEDIQHRMDIGADDEDEGAAAIMDIGVEFQLVTDETSMIVLADEAFARHGIDRRNRERTSRERSAQATRKAAPVRSYRVDEEAPAFNQRAPRPNWGNGSGGGAVDIWILALAAGAVFAARRRQSADEGKDAA